MEKLSSGLGKCLLDGSPEKEAQLVDEDGGKEDCEDKRASGDDEQGQGELTVPTEDGAVVELSDETAAVSEIDGEGRDGKPVHYPTVQLQLAEEQQEEEGRKDDVGRVIEEKDTTKVEMALQEENGEGGEAADDDKESEVGTPAETGKTGAMDVHIAGQEVEAEERRQGIAGTQPRGSLEDPAEDPLEEEKEDEGELQLTTGGLCDIGIEDWREEIEGEVGLDEPVVAFAKHKQRLEGSRREGALNGIEDSETENAEEENLEQEFGNTVETQSDAIPSGQQHKNVDSHDRETLSGQLEETRERSLCKAVGCRMGQGPVASMDNHHHKHGYQAQ